MKKKLVILLAAVCAVTLLGGCGNEEKQDKKNDKKGNASAKELEYEASEYVKLGEYKGIKVKLDSAYEVTEEAVRSNVESLIAAYPAYEDTDKTTVEEGDFVNIDYEGLKDGEAFAGGTAKGSVLEIGSKSFIEGFEEGLIGAKTGEKVALDLTFPEDYKNEELAGQAVVFNVTVNKIVTPVEMTYDTMTDEYVAANFSLSGYETIEALKNGVKEQLAKTNESNKEKDIQKAVVEKLKEACTIDNLPEEVLEKRIKEYKEQLEAALKESNLEMKGYLESLNTTQEEFDAQIEQLMKDNLEMEMILTVISDKEKIEADEEGYKAYVAGVVQNAQYENEEALMKEYGEAYIKQMYRNNKAMDVVRENAVVTLGEAAAEE